MSNATLFIIAFLSVAAVMLATAAPDIQKFADHNRPDYQAYTEESR